LVVNDHDQPPPLTKEEQFFKGKINIMKRLVLLSVLLGAIYACHAQLSPDELKKMRKKKTTNYAITGTMIFMAGAADGINQALQYHYGAFKKIVPHANDRFWKPTLSGANKYKNGDPAQGAKFPGSRTWLVFTTDGNHLTRFVDHLLWAGAIAIKLSCNEKKKWYVYVMEVAGYWLVNRVGFCFVYNNFTPTR
jgi:hypothetical protein